MKRFLLFGLAEYDPSGGLNDFLLDYDTIEEAKEAIAGAEVRCAVYQILDTATGKEWEAWKRNGYSWSMVS